ncbi:metallophosphatase family protein [Aliifodinibius sp. S!AR15-10]|uniref:metallophosphoesterase family protein n=1 Tax=Aliifodinibius sp. S!AR15-10 TaxID=2950437 RepID=UPI00285A2C8C|nr:metallophosphoesterase family protein [Aliifodinibius sp. S!AR15-10]MDR8392588.1 metallophosphatase family protein [Aliifodinibius sp. S!AR15-10]
MKKIGLISDTHNYLDPQVFEYFGDCDEIWHAGDFGNYEIADQLKKIAPVIGVYGNIDGQDIRKEYPQHQRFNVEGVDVWMTHIGGTLGRYCIPIREEMENNPPDMFICGHSHILKIGRDEEKGQMLFVNPGAAGRHGFQVYRTCVRFEIGDGKIQNMEVINLGTMGQD